MSDVSRAVPMGVASQSGQMSDGSRPTQLAITGGGPVICTVYNGEMNNAKVNVVSGLSMNALPGRMASGGL